ncbi:unnamed protein product [Boreogadus saida]
MLQLLAGFWGGPGGQSRDLGCTTLPSTRPSSALAEIGDGSFSGWSPSRRARDRSMMLSSAPESTRAVTGWEPEGNRSSPERVGLVDAAESVMELTSMPLVTGELWLLPGIDRRSVQAGRSTDRGSASVFSPSPPEKDGCGPAPLALDSPFSGERLGSVERRRGLPRTTGGKDCVAEPQNPSPFCEHGFRGQGVYRARSGLPVMTAGNRQQAHP